jgi:hypothetical protein
MALARSWSPSAPSRYLLSHAAASIVVGTFTVILLKWFVWKLLLEVDAVTVASGGCPSAQRVVHHWLGLNSLARTTARNDLHQSRHPESPARSPVVEQRSWRLAEGSGAAAKDGFAEPQAGLPEGCYPTTRRTVGPSKPLTLDEPPRAPAPSAASVRLSGRAAHDAPPRCLPALESRGQTPYGPLLQATLQDACNGCTGLQGPRKSLADAPRILNPSTQIGRRGKGGHHAPGTGQSHQGSLRQ